MNYSSSAYSGPAIKLGAGVQAAAAYEAAHSVGHRIVGGRCPTTGIAGGFLMGGGHSQLTGTHGLAADNVLEWEVITANGTHTTVAPDRNPDLYWALSGGGGGTYAVVVSATIRLHRDVGPIGGARLVFNVTSPTSSVEDYWAAISVALAGTGPIIDSGAFFAGTFTSVRALFTMTAPGQTANQVRSRLQFLVDHLDRHRVPYAFNVSTHSNYFDHFVDYYGPLPDAGLNINVRATSRIIPRSVYEAAPMHTPASPLVVPAPSSLAKPGVAELTRIYRNIAVEPGWLAINIGMRGAPPNAPPVAANAVHPAWRTAGAIALIYAPWDLGARPEAAAANAARERKLTDVIDPAFKALTPQSGTYLNEANWAMRDLLRESYGPNLARLRRVKQRYDPDGVFYAPHAVGSEAWVVDEEGRLCHQQRRE
jgi:FAD/FMN-containing dehydrogenase